MVEKNTNRIKNRYKKPKNRYIPIEKKTKMEI